MKKLVLLLVVVLAVLVFAGCNNDPDTTYRVTYLANANGTIGFPPTDSNEYKAGDEATVLGPGTLLRTGYSFLRWNTNADGSGSSYSEGDKITINGAVFLYAIWVARP